MSEAAARVGVAPTVASYHLGALAAMGVLERRKHGREVVYRANTSCPILPELRSIMIKTVGLVDRVREALAALEGIRVAFIYGSFAEGTPRPDSDIDLFVVGEAGLRDLVPVLGPLEEALARQISPVVMGSEEFSGRLANRDHFVDAVWKGPKLMVRGEEGDLERVGSRRKTGRAAGKRTGDRGAVREGNGAHPRRQG